MFVQNNITYIEIGHRDIWYPYFKSFLGHKARYPTEIIDNDLTRNYLCIIITDEQYNNFCTFKQTIRARRNISKDEKMITWCNESNIDIYNVADKAYVYLTMEQRSAFNTYLLKTNLAKYAEDKRKEPVTHRSYFWR